MTQPLVAFAKAQRHGTARYWRYIDIGRIIRSKYSKNKDLAFPNLMLWPGLDFLPFVTAAKHPSLNQNGCLESNDRTSQKTSMHQSA